MAKIGVHPVGGENGNLVLGTYTGDDVYPRTIKLGFRPRVLMIAGERLHILGYPVFVMERDFCRTDRTYDYASITDDGFTIFGGNINESYRTLNGTNKNIVGNGVFSFIAIR